MENAKGTVFKYKDNVDTDVIIPARYLNTPNAKELASHCMEDIDTSFVQKVKSGDIMVAGWKLWLWIIQRACTTCHQDVWYQCGHCQKLCPHLLSQCHQYRTSDFGV